MIGDQGHAASGDNGYALVAAVASILFIGVMALGILALTRRVLVTGGADVDAARVSAAAEAGIALALRGLLSDNPGEAIAADGRHRQIMFDRAKLDISVTDERGKVPLNLVDETQLTSLLEYVGLSGEPLEIARDSFLDWIDDDDEVRANGAEADYYRVRGLRTRNAGFVTLGELARVRGFSPSTVQKIAAVATTDFGNGSFDTHVASAEAIRIMYPKGDAAIDEIISKREAQGQTTAFAFSDRTSWTGRPLTIIATASLASGASAQRRCTIELTGADRRPYVIRHCD
ncbi:general secretion pathway protein GspK [Sphingomonas sp.]|uniref:general secretion pathway protein GspK n=1 Tax=Sphingomonas sp. TaxID=28214 RepID=UPI0025D81D53|nr:type II secretion system protein GspK [Sphingomonas sp.]